MITAEIARDCVPAGSFVYGQLASIEGLDAPLDKWMIATDCAKAKNDHPTGADGFDTVLCVHFILSDEAEARRCGANLTQYDATLIHPADNL